MMLKTSAWRIAPNVVAGLLFAGWAGAQPAGVSPLTPPPNGMKSADPTWHALTNATVHVSPSQTVEHATVVLRGGRIVSVLASRGDGEQSVRPPAGARVWDCTGLHVYAGFIDPYMEVDAPQPDPRAPGTHWNTRVTPQRSALDGTGLDERTAEAMRKMGFTAAAISPRGGIFRGSSAVVSLAKPAADSAADRPPVYSGWAYQSVAFETAGFGSDGGYPDSQMGAIAVVRQAMLDESWQRAARAAGEAVAPNALDALAPWCGSDGRPSPAPAAKDGAAPPSAQLLFDTRNELEALRALKIAGEFSRAVVILGSGSEFKRIEGLTAEGKPAFILPLNFPKTPDVSSVGKAEAVELSELMAWEQAPTNPRRLRQAGVHVALTTSKLRDRTQFTENLRKAIKHGLSPSDALAALTTTPATICGVTGQLGSVEQGKRANLVVADGDLFAIPTPAQAGEKDEKKEPKIRDVWVDGARYEINAAPDKTAVGAWKVTEADGKPVDPDSPDVPRVIIDDKNAVTIQVGEKKAKATNVRIAGDRVDYVYDDQPFGHAGQVTDQATIQGDTMIGITRLPSGEIHRWKATRTGPPPAEQKAEGLPGKWKIVTIDGKPGGDDAVITIKDDKSLTLFGQGKEAKLTDIKVEGDQIAYTVDMSAQGGEGVVKVMARRAGDVLEGSMIVPDGSTHTWTAARQPAEKSARPEEPDPTRDIPEKLGLPFGPYALDAPPPQERVLVTNATIWTSGPQGIVRDAAMLVAGGKIIYVGPSASLPRVEGNFRTIDAAGKHITPGLIDCHSHTGISGGVNEGGQSCTAEVRIGDVTDPDAINWYRQLAGGLTAVNSLHGSANPIGGQNQVNKIRWGVRTPDEMHLEGAKPGIKFALGENVKRSRSTSNTRYPDTRMGVETYIRDRFTAAREYAAAWKRWNASDKKGVPPRRDLELDALAEVLAGERLVHCHSYRQDEILMLARVAADFGFKIGTYQHGLECYKVADVVRQAALGASLFSDWWAYKVEVQDAIPQAGPILHEQGVVVSYNSDSDELARRMNAEAAKAVKYGSLRPEEALKFVTINPAIQLAIADRVGSLEEGKDADFVVWSGDPLSAFSRCEATFIDGREYFSLERDARLRERIAGERQRLIQKVLAESKPKAGDDRPRPDGPPAGGPDPSRPGRRRPPSEDAQAAAIREYFMRKLGRGDAIDTDGCGECGMALDNAINGGW
jgi:imidazolonepropionase-like amidohydrolase